MAAKRPNQAVVVAVLRQIRDGQNAMRGEMTDLREDMTTMRGEMAGMRKDLNGRFDKLNSNPEAG
jgi:hypothetical protein